MQNSTFKAELSRSVKDAIRKAAGGSSSTLNGESGKASVFMNLSVLREIQRTEP